ncbi:MAG: CapA family protein [bacterium]|nr:CapA family protein [bacterium]
MIKKNKIKNKKRIGSMINIRKVILAMILVLVPFTLVCFCVSNKEMVNMQSRIGDLNEEVLSRQNEVTNLQREIFTLNKEIIHLGKKKFSILFVGDILLANEAEGFMIKFGKDYPFKKIKEDLEKYDTVFGNLETPISVRGKPVFDKPYIFEVDPRNASFLREIKLDVVSISNNHIMDYGVEAMDDTINNLKKWGILYTGAGRNLAQARVPAKLQFGHTEIYILAYCERPPSSFYATSSKPGTAPLNVRYIAQDIKKYKTEDNIVLVSLHWGIEQTQVPTRSQRVIARRIINSGADGIIGHHPHWPQGIEVYKNKPVIYSLGNFINGHYNKKEMDNIMVGFYYDANKLKKIEIQSIAGKNKLIHFQPYVLKNKSARKNLMVMKRLSRQLSTSIDIERDKGVILF